MSEPTPLGKTSLVFSGELAEAVVDHQRADRVALTEAERAPGIKGKKRSKAQVAEETAWCFDQQLAGRSCVRIAADSLEHFGYRISSKTVWRRIEEAIAQRINPRVDQLRAIEEARYDGYLAALQPDVERGDEKAINAALRVAERRARLLGLDAPVKIGVDATVHYLIEGVDTDTLS